MGSVMSPTTPAVNTTTFVARTYAALASICDDSLVSTNADILDGLYYGGVDTPTTLHLAAQLASLEHGKYAVLCPSGQSAIAVMAGAMAQSGDHVLVADTVIYSTKWLFDRYFGRLGVDIEYFDPTTVDVLEEAIRPNTKLVFFELPGSFTYELFDLSRAAEICRKKKVVSAVDSTWAASTFCYPLQHDIDIVVLSLGKTHAGIAGVSLGAIITSDHVLFTKSKAAAALLGCHVNSNACSDALIAMSTLAPRLAQQMKSTETAINVFRSHSKVIRVLHPSIPTNLDYCLFRRFFSGFNSLVSVELNLSRCEIVAVIDRLKVVNIGYGWGGAISLVSIFDPNEWRSASRSRATGLCARFYIGLENENDIAEDILRALY